MVRIFKSLIFFSFASLLISCSDNIPEIVEDSPKAEAKKYFPLNISDKFVYDSYESLPCTDFNAWQRILYKKHVEVIKDTLIESKKYFVFKIYQDIYEWEYSEFDSDSSFHFKDTSIIRNLSTEYYRISDGGVLHEKLKGSSSIFSRPWYNLAATEIDTMYNQFGNYDIYLNCRDYTKFSV